MAFIAIKQGKLTSISLMGREVGKKGEWNKNMMDKQKGWERNIEER